MADQKGFLDNLDGRNLELPESGGFRPVKLLLGQGNMGLEVAVAEADSKPSTDTVRTVWSRRLAGRAAPLLLVVTYGNHAAICGPEGEAPMLIVDLETSLVERLCAAALEAPDRHSAIRMLWRSLEQLGAPIPGIRNEGFVATQELKIGVRQRTDWDSASKRALSVISRKGKDLIRSLGFEIIETEGPVSLLVSGASKVAIAAFLDRSETPEMTSDRFSGMSPISYTLARGDQESLPYVVLTTESSIRLYPVKIGVGVGRRGRTETYVEAQLGMLTADTAAYLWYLFSADALCSNGTLDLIIEKSADYVADLGGRLRERVYEDVIPDLARAIAEARSLKSPTVSELDETLQMALTLLFRLLFIAYAEDKELLPYHTNPHYRKRSLKQLAQELLEYTRKGTAFGESNDFWMEVNNLFRAVSQGRPEWGVPAYGGTLFSEDSIVSPIGHGLSVVSLANNVLGPILCRLLLDEGPEGLGPVDFRSLSVREFGTIYEGLLESQLARATNALFLESNGFYRAAEKGESPDVKRGSYYLTNTSGKRKATGSYFTKPFAVEHLLDHALEPAVTAHLKRLDELPDDEASGAFFDFRVADIAMGSGHFLVAALDRIERRMSNYLARRRLPGVIQELTRLRSAALNATMDTSGIEIEDNQLLRRQIARRCIYGVDLNPVAVNLARVSLWIHTFVPGLPLSLLDNHLLHGNSLIGVATSTEFKELLGAEGLDESAESGGTPDSKGGHQAQLTDDETRAFFKKIAADMERIGELSDASAAEVRRAFDDWKSAVASSKPYQQLMDIMAASRVDARLSRRLHETTNVSRFASTSVHKEAQDALAEHKPFHFLLSFPEVFFRSRPGFDVMIGNPPWEEATVEEDKFWIRFSPGLASLKQSAQEALKRRLRRERPDLVLSYERERQRASELRQLLVAGPYPGMGVGDPDLYKAFCWRFWSLLAGGGFLGVVLPRNVFASKGSEEFRRALLAEGCISDITLLLNNRHWVFEDVHPQYTIALISASKKQEVTPCTVPLRGPYASYEEFKKEPTMKPVSFSTDEVESWTDSAAIPSFPRADSIEVFIQIRRAPRFDEDRAGQWLARPVAELHATNEKSEMDLSKTPPKGFWPVYGGGSFDIWQPDLGEYYAHIDPKKAEAYLQHKRLQAACSSSSAFNEFDEKWLRSSRTLPCLHPRIAFRDVTNSTNRRTVIAALVPPRVALSNTAPFLLWSRGDEKDQAYLLGVLCSLPLDWYARRFVEMHVNFHILNALPIPRPRRSNMLWKRVVQLAGRLASPDRRFLTWAKAVGAEVGQLSESEKEDMVAELDAVVAHLYNLSEAQFSHVFETFHPRWDYGPRMSLALQHYRRWAGRT